MEISVNYWNNKLIIPANSNIPKDLKKVISVNWIRGNYIQDFFDYYVNSHRTCDFVKFFSKNWHDYLLDWKHLEYIWTEIFLIDYPQVAFLIEKSGKIRSICALIDKETWEIKQLPIDYQDLRFYSARNQMVLTAINWSKVIINVA